MKLELDEATINTMGDALLRAIKAEEQDPNRWLVAWSALFQAFGRAKLDEAVLAQKVEEEARQAEIERRVREAMPMPAREFEEARGSAGVVVGY